MSIIDELPIHEKLADFPAVLEAYEYAVESVETNHVPSSEELVLAWEDIYDSSAYMTALDGIYGVMRHAKKENPWAVASIDLCEVTRETAGTFMALGGFTVEHAGEEYDYGKPYELEDNPEAITRIVQAIMSRDQVTPVEGIEDIQRILSEARASGVYVIANTSTLPGCEISTLRWLKQYLPDCFDGIVLPRNHDGKGAVTKGTAKEAVIAVVNNGNDIERITHTIHIDDAPHHIRAVRETVSKLAITGHADFTPRYTWNAKHDDMNHQDTPHSSFVAAYETLASWRK